MKGYKFVLKTVFLLLIFSIIVGNSLTSTVPIYAEYGRAIFQRVYYSPKIYDGETEVFDFVVYNYDIDDSSKKPLFFIRLYANKAQIYDEYLNPWPCKKGATVSHKIEIENWKGPQEYVIEAHLFFLNETVPILLDTKRFEITVIKLFVNDWKQEPKKLSIEWSSELPKTLTISFRNGGNDFMSNVSVEIMDSAGLEVKPIYVQLGNIKAGEARIVNYSIIVPQEASIGNKVLKLRIKYFDFKGSEHFELKTAFLEITKLMTSIRLSYDGETKVGSPLLVIAKLVDKDGNPIPSERIDFYIDSTNIGHNMTNNYGTAYLNYKLNLNAGKYSLKAIFEGSSKLASSNTSITLNISKISVSVETNLPSSFSVDEPAAISVILKDERGTPIPDQEIKLYLNVSSPLVYKTDLSGKALISLTLREKGNHSFLIVYEGNENFLGARYEKSIVVNPIQTKLTLSLPWFPFKGSQAKLSAFLKDEKNNPIPNAIVKFFVDEGDGKAKELGRSKTDTKGVASVNYEPSKDGAIKVFAVYEGNQKYGESKTMSSLNVINMVLILGIVSATTLSVIGTFLFLKFERGIDLISEIKKRFQKSRFLQQPPVIKRVDAIEPAREALSYEIKNCIHCGSIIPKNANFCDRCGKKQDIEDFQKLDEKVYGYIVEHEGTISLSKACADLGIRLEELRESIERLKKTGKLI